MTINREWLKHCVGSLVASGAIYGLIAAFVPQGHKAQAYALVPVVAYLTGVAAPSPRAGESDEKKP